MKIIFRKIKMIFYFESQILILHNQIDGNVARVSPTSYVCMAHAILANNWWFSRFDT